MWKHAYWNQSWFKKKMNGLVFLKKVFGVYPSGNAIFRRNIRELRNRCQYYI